MDTRERKELQAFGKQFSRVRKSRGFTQEQLAEKADLTTLSIGFIEQGRRWPRLSTLQKLARCLGVPVGEFFNNL